MKKETDFTLPEEYLNKSNLIPKVEQIELLAKHILDLQKDKGYLTDKVRELEQENEQIKNSDTLCKLIGEQKLKIAELEKQIEKAKELLGDWLQVAHKNHTRCYGFVKDTEQFLAEN